MKKVSVIMPTYNAEKYLREAVDSILTQTFSDFEFLVIDDASTDKTRAILKSYGDPRIKVIDGPCNGIAAALNLGLDMAEGEYIARMDADDISMPRRLEKQVQFLDIHPEIGLCGTLAMMFTKDGDYKLFGEKHLEDMGIVDQLFDTVVCHPTVMFRRELFERYDLRYNEEYRNAEDQELWSRALRYTKFYGIQEMLLRYRLHSESASQARLAEGKAVVESIHRNILQWLLPSGDYEEEIQPKIDGLFQLLERKNKRTTASERGLEIPKVSPVFRDNYVPILTCSSEKYGVYCGVMLHSIISHASAEKNYDIVILTQDMRGETKARLEKLAEGKENISIRFCYLDGLLEQFSHCGKEHIPIITDSRLLIPEMLEEYQKVLWFDVDAVTNRDMAELYDLDLGDNLIAAAHDIGMAGGDGSEEMFSKLGMSRNNYINAGILLINCEQMRKEVSPQELLQTATSPDFDNMDQDALNYHCKGKIKYFDMRWNVNATNTNSARAIAYLAEEYRRARENPCVVHYIGPVKPWDALEMPMARYFWKYAAETEFYEELLHHALEVATGKDSVQQRANQTPAYLGYPAHIVSLGNDIYYGKQWKRTIVWALYDRKTLKEKAKEKLRGHPVTYTVAKYLYKLLRGIKNIFRR